MEDTILFGSIINPDFPNLAPFVAAPWIYFFVMYCARWYLNPKEEDWDGSIIELALGAVFLVSLSIPVINKDSGLVTLVAAGSTVAAFVTNMFDGFGLRATLIIHGKMRIDRKNAINHWSENTRRLHEYYGRHHDAIKGLLEGDNVALETLDVLGGFTLGLPAFAHSLNKAITDQKAVVAKLYTEIRGFAEDTHRALDKYDDARRKLRKLEQVNRRLSESMKTVVAALYDAELKAKSTKPRKAWVARQLEQAQRSMASVLTNGVIPYDPEARLEGQVAQA